MFSSHCSAGWLLLFLLTHLLDLITLSSSSLPLPFSPYTLCKHLTENPLYAHLNLALGFYPPPLFFLVYSVANIHGSPPIVPDQGIHTQILPFRSIHLDGDRLQAKVGRGRSFKWWSYGDSGLFSSLPTIENMIQQIFRLKASSKSTSCLHFLGNSLGLWLYHLTRFPHSPPRCRVARHQLKAGMVWLILGGNESSASSVSNEEISFYGFKTFYFTFMLLLEFILNNALV